MDGKLAPSLRAEPVPLDNFGPLVHVVASTMDALVLQVCNHHV